MSKFVSFSCFLWQLSVPFFHTNGKYNARSDAWLGELSAIFVMKLKQRSSSYRFSPLLVNFVVFMCHLTSYQHIAGKHSGVRLVKFIHFQSCIHK